MKRYSDVFEYTKYLISCGTKISLVCVSFQVCAVIFDDNVGRAGSKEAAHIVDVRDVATGLPVPFHLALQRHLVRAEPYLAIVPESVTDDRPVKAVNRAHGGRTGNYFLVEILKRLRVQEEQVELPSLSAREP